MEAKEQTFKPKSGLEIQMACRAQMAYAQVSGAGLFAPSDGSCWACRRNIYQDYVTPGGDISKGYSIERADSQLITGCPHCHRSFCD